MVHWRLLEPSATSASAFLLHKGPAAVVFNRFGAWSLWFSLPACDPFLLRPLVGMASTSEGSGTMAAPPYLMGGGGHAGEAWGEGGSDVGCDEGKGVGVLFPTPAVDFLDMSFVKAEAAWGTLVSIGEGLRGIAAAPGTAMPPLCAAEALASS